MVKETEDKLNQEAANWVDTCYHESQFSTKTKLKDAYIAAARIYSERNEESLAILEEAKYMLVECRIQLDYLTEKFGGTGTTESVVSRIETMVQKIEKNIESKKP